LTSITASTTRDGESSFPPALPLPIQSLITQIVCVALGLTHAVVSNGACIVRESLTHWFPVPSQFRF
jgi:hypothetical protein